MHTISHADRKIVLIFVFDASYNQEDEAKLHRSVQCH